MSLATGKPFRIDNIRANRPKPELLRQHHAGLADGLASIASRAGPVVDRARRRHAQRRGAPVRLPAAGLPADRCAHRRQVAVTLERPGYYPTGGCAAPRRGQPRRARGVDGGRPPGLRDADRWRRGLFRAGLGGRGRVRHRLRQRRDPDQRDAARCRGCSSVCRPSPTRSGTWCRSGWAARTDRTMPRSIMRCSRARRGVRCRGTRPRGAPYQGATRSSSPDWSHPG